MAHPASLKEKPLLIVIAGPTGAGKSEVALRLARRLKGEIVNCDSMQVYRGMDIGTAKPTPAVRKKIRHHLIDILDPSRKMNAERFSRLARKAIEEIVERGKIPVLAGGSGLYLRATLRGIFPGVGADPGLRKKLYRRLERVGSKALHARLKKVDPEAARKIHPNDGRRIVRALEVYRKTGKPISLLQKQREGLGSEYRPLWFALSLDREELYRRINTRVDGMFKKGLFGEVKRLAEKRMGLTSRRAVGYAEVLSCLKREIPLERAVELVKRNSRRYAKRQLSWFRQEKSIHWVAVSKKETADRLARQILRQVKHHV